MKTITRKAQKESDENYKKSIAEADKQFKQKNLKMQFHYIPKHLNLNRKKPILSKKLQKLKYNSHFKKQGRKLCSPLQSATAFIRN